MKRFFLECAWLGGAFLLIPIQTSLLPFLFHPFLTIDVALVVALILSFLHLPGRALQMAFLMTIILDLQSTLPFGIMLSIMAATLTFLRFLQQMVFKQEHGYASIIITVLITLFARFAFYAALLLLEEFQLITEHVTWNRVTEGLAVQLVIHSLLVVCGMMLWRRGKNFMFIRAARY